MVLGVPDVLDGGGTAMFVLAGDGFSSLLRNIFVASHSTCRRVDTNRIQLQVVVSGRDFHRYLPRSHCCVGLQDRLALGNT